jgi:hypothetical protein
VRQTASTGRRHHHWAVNMGEGRAGCSTSDAARSSRCSAVRRPRGRSRRARSSRTACAASPSPLRTTSPALDRDVPREANEARTPAESSGHIAGRPCLFFDADVTMRFWEARLAPVRVAVAADVLQRASCKCRLACRLRTLCTGPWDHHLRPFGGFAAKEGLFMFANKALEGIVFANRSSVIKVRYCRKRGAYLRIVDEASLGVGD